MTATVKTENGSGDVNVADGKDDQIASQIEVSVCAVFYSKDVVHLC
jgi:hypothetical protein